MKDRINKLLNNMLHVLKNKEPKQVELQPFCKELDDILYHEVKDVMELPERQFLRYDEDTRLDLIDNEIEAFKKCPECGLISAVDYCQKKLQEFLKKYNIGFIHSIELNVSGYLEVNLWNSIHIIDSFHQKAATKEMELEFQMDLLKFNGINIKKDKDNDYCIIADTESITSLETLLKKEMDARIMNIKVSYSDLIFIRETTFYVKPETLMSKNWNSINVSFNEQSGILNPNQVQQLYHLIKELFSTYCNMKEIKNIESTCASLIRSYFTEICDLCAFEGTISIAHHKIHDPIRKKNELIANKRNELGKMMSGNLKILMANVCNRVDQYVFEKLNFQSLNTVVTPYGIKIRFSFATGFNFNSYKQMTDEEIWELYDTNKGSIKNEDLKISATEKNQKLIENFIKNEFLNAVISEIKIENHWSVDMNYIREFCLNIDNLNFMVH